MSEPDHILVMLMLEFYKIERIMQRNDRNDAIARYYSAVYTRGGDAVLNQIDMKNYADEWNNAARECSLIEDTIKALRAILKR